MTAARIKATRARFEEESGDLQGLVQLKMFVTRLRLSRAITVASSPCDRTEASASCYQFIGRGIRVLMHPALEGRVKPSDQVLDVIYHAELGLDLHDIETIYRENDMDPSAIVAAVIHSSRGPQPEVPGTRGHDVASRPEAFVALRTRDAPRAADRPRSGQGRAASRRARNGGTCAEVRRIRCPQRTQSLSSNTSNFFETCMSECSFGDRARLRPVAVGLPTSSRRPNARGARRPFQASSTR